MNKILHLVPFAAFMCAALVAMLVAPHGATVVSSAAPFQNPNAIMALRNYADLRPGKAFAASVTLNSWGWSSGNVDREAAKAAALRECELRGVVCLLYAVDDTIVWDPVQADAMWAEIVSTRAPSGETWRYHNEENPHAVASLLPPEAPSIISDYRSAYGILGNLRQSYKGTPSRHRGIDIIGAIGTPVLAAADGVVLAADFQDTAGNRVRIAHTALYAPLPLVTEYLHLDQILVDPGDMVLRGQQIGTVGTTGSGTTPERPHLHFETWGTNPHLYWYDGAGRVTCYSEDRSYAGDQIALTYPLRCSSISDVEHP